MLNLIYLCFLSIAYINCSPHNNSGVDRYCTTARTNCSRVCETKDYRFSEANGLIYVIESNSPFVTSYKCLTFILRQYVKPYTFFLTGQTLSPYKTEPKTVVTGHFNRGQKGSGISAIVSYNCPFNMRTYDTLVLADNEIGYSVYYNCVENPDGSFGTVVEIFGRKPFIDADTIANIHYKLEDLGLDISNLVRVDQTNCY